MGVELSCAARESECYSSWHAASQRTLALGLIGSGSVIRVASGAVASGS
jgi:hypothetical protein